MKKLLELINCADKRKVGMHVAMTFFITVLGYNSITPQELTSWTGVGDILLEVISNPYLLGLCFWNAYSAICNNDKIKESEINE